jgi:DNA-binding NtrC family response regulator
MTTTPSKILLADDEDLFAVMLQRSLAMFGYEVVRARNGREALLAYQPANFGLVITDLIMPDMEGVELIVALRRVNPAVKIIAMSGGGRNHPQSYLHIAEKIGALRTLAKPFPIPDLVAAIHECLEPGQPAPDADATVLIHRDPNLPATSF